MKMKKHLLFLLIFLAFCLLSAFTWPPDNYEMPRAALDAATAEETLSGLRGSLGSIANVGLVLIGIITSVSLISTVFKRLFLDKLDSFRPPRPRSHSGLSLELSNQVRERNLGGGLGIRRRIRGGDNW